MASATEFSPGHAEKAYKKSIQTLLQKRMTLLYAALGAPAPRGSAQTAYYNMINLQDLAARLHGPEFAAYLTSEFTPFDLLMHLARAYQTVLLPGVGFAGPDWSVRVSLANLPDESYEVIGRNLVDTMQDFRSYQLSAR